jgi:hypothetical protein
MKTLGLDIINSIKALDTGSLIVIGFNFIRHFRIIFMADQESYYY